VTLEASLAASQSSHIARAYRSEAAEAVAGFCRVMCGIINEEDRALFVSAGFACL